MKKSKFFVSSLAFGLSLCLNPALSLAGSVEEAIIQSGCLQTDLGFAQRFNDDSVTSHCVEDAESLLKQSTIPTSDRVQDLLSFRIHFIEKICDNTWSQFKIACLRGASVELQKNYAQAEINIAEPVLSCPTHVKYFSTPRQSSESQINCIHGALNKAAKNEG